RRIWVNVVDDAQLSTFHVPARLSRGPLTIAISSGGTAPAMARRLRAQLEVRLDRSLGQLATLTARHRERIRKAWPELTERHRFYDQLVDGPVGVLTRQNRLDEAEQAFEK